MRRGRFIRKSSGLVAGCPAIVVAVAASGSTKATRWGRHEFDVLAGVAGEPGSDPCDGAFGGDMVARVGRHNGAKILESRS